MAYAFLEVGGMALVMQLKNVLIEVVLQVESAPEDTEYVVYVSFKETKINLS